MRYRKANESNIEEVQYSVAFRYLAEGAANIVYQIIPGAEEEDKTHTFVLVRPNGTVYHRNVSLGRVLRISKGLPKTLSAEQVKSLFEKEIKPHFTEKRQKHLMDPWLVDLDEQVLSTLTLAISDRDDATNADFLDLVKQGTKGLLLEDMFSLQGKERTIQAHPPGIIEGHGDYLEGPVIYGKGVNFTLEMKPKWLEQSPNAPESARRCRTCAKRAQKEEMYGPDDNPYLCPLQFKPHHGTAILPFVERKVQKAFEKHNIQLNKNTEKILAVRVYDDLTDRTKPGWKLIAHLRKLQEKHDKEGVLVSKDDHGLRLAMTLRDCSLFIEVRMDATLQKYSVRFTLGDLDFKSAAKIDDWAEKERDLINGGWYLDDSVATTEEADEKEKHCYLSPSMGVPPNAALRSLALRGGGLADEDMQEDGDAQGLVKGRRSRTDGDEVSPSFSRGENSPDPPASPM